MTHICDIPHTVIMAGDHNSSHADLSPTSARRVLARTSTDSQSLTESMMMNAYEPARIDCLLT